MELSILIIAVDSERRDIVRWLIMEKSANVNQICKNHETALMRAIFRNNELILRDLLEFGADMTHERKPMNWTMPMEALMRDKITLYDMMLEHGASFHHSINGKPCNESL